MKRHFNFGGRESFHALGSRELADLLLRERPAVLRELKEELGLTLEFEANSVRMAHDGRRVGVASIPTAKGEIVVSIFPKLESMRVRAMLTDLDALSVSLPQLSLSARLSIGNVDAGRDDLSIAFSLALLEDVLACAQLLEGALRKRRIVMVNGGIRGRPLIERSTIDLLLGRSLGFSCEVPEDEHLAEYKKVLLATGLSIVDMLGVWMPTLHGEGLTSEGLRARLIASFRGVDASAVTISSVLRVCRPPFPFGLKDVLYRSLRYWKWRGQYAPSSNGSKDKFFAMSIYLDKLFEVYVGAYFQQVCLPHLQFRADASHGYRLVQEGKAESREIILDHVFESKEHNLVLIVDAKYSEAVAASQQVYQLIAYLNYRYPEFANRKMIGVLAYPGEEWQVGEVQGFNKTLFTVRIPASARLSVTQGRQFISELIARREAVH